MIIIDNFHQVAAQIESERGITKEVLISAIEQALVSASRKKMQSDAWIEVELDVETGEAKIYQKTTVVKEIENPAQEIELKEAKKKDKSLKEGDILTEELNLDNFGRIAAQTAKQVIIQRIREAEKNAIFEEFQHRVGQIIVGTVQRVENRNYLVNLGKTEAVLFSRDQIPGETFHPKEKIRIYLADIERNSRGTFLNISRTHKDFLRKLLEAEIPEIQDNIIEIMSIARDPGKRAKVAVKSNNPAIGAVGTCVGHMGGRIQSVIVELGKEKIDVLEWDENPRLFIANALKPAKISQVVIIDEEQRTALAVVQKDQLSLAIGKNGLNVRLAVNLTGWKLDILSEGEYEEKADKIREEAKITIVDKIKMEKEEQAKGLFIKKEEKTTGLSLAEKLAREKPKAEKVAADIKEEPKIEAENTAEIKEEVASEKEEEPKKKAKKKTTVKKATAKKSTTKKTVAKKEAKK